MANVLQVRQTAQLSQALGSDGRIEKFNADELSEANEMLQVAVADRRPRQLNLLQVRQALQVTQLLL